MSPTRALGPVLGALVLVGCAASAPPDGALDGAAPSAEAGACGGPLELGRCMLEDGSECRGLLDEPAVFVPLDDGDPVPVLLGHQGSNMLALAARTHGIVPGDPATPSSRVNPIVELELVTESGERLAVSRGRAAFEPDPEEPDLFVLPELVVVVDGALDRLDALVIARATVRDSAGAVRCGQLALRPLIDPAP